jgi:hypothetical protein
VDFWAGAGDTVSFGGTDWIREKVGWNDVVDECSDAYSYGSYTAIGIQLAATGGSMALRYGAKGITQAVARAGKPLHYRSMYPTGKNITIHHKNPLKGHPVIIWPGFQQYFGNTAVFPTAGLPAAMRHGVWNLGRVSLARHEYLHKRLMIAEAIAKTLFNPMTIPVRTGDAVIHSCRCP